MKMVRNRTKVGDFNSEKEVELSNPVLEKDPLDKFKKPDLKPDPKSKKQSKAS